MTFGNVNFDLADIRAEQEREAGIKRAQVALAAVGADVCVDCDDEIAPARRRAMPSATRCIKCQARYENERGIS